MSTLSNLHLFCECIVRKYKSPERATEEQKAEEFRRMFLQNFKLNLKALMAVAATCGIKLDELDEATMPKNLRGYHEIYKSRRYIYFRKDDTLSGTMNTILHEIREIIETVFVEIHPSYQPLRTNARHIAANKFASAVLLPQKSFTDDLYNTGLDVIELAKLYSKSCSQVLLRIGEVLQGKQFFYGALYEPDSDGNNKWRVTYWTKSGNHDDLEANVYGLDGFFPRKGQEVKSDSLVDMTIKKGKAHLARRITLLDEMDDEGLVAIANPLMIQDYPAKVVVVVLMARDNKLFMPQIERTKPVIVESMHRQL